MFPLIDDFFSEEINMDHKKQKINYYKHLLTKNYVLFIVIVLRI